MPEVIKTILTADSTELRSEFSRASAALATYQTKQQAGFSKAISSYQSEIAALRLQKDGFTNLANSLRETTSLKQQAAALAVSANITEEKALSLLREKQLLQQQITAGVAQEAAARAAAAARATAIANPRATGLPGGGLGLAPLTPQSLQAMDRQIASTRELRRQTLLAGQSGKNGALGFLAFSQAVEDAQYGIKGVLNNIPQMVLGFGGTAGLAGAISLAAVAATILYPKLKQLYGATDNENVKKAAEEWDKIFKAGIAAANQFEKAAASEREMLNLAGQLNQAFAQRIGIVSQMGKYYDEELTSVRQRRDMEAQILDARLKLAQATGLGIPQAQAAVENAATQGLDADLINRQKEYARVQDDVMRKVEIAANITAEANAQDLADTARLVELKRQLAGADANVASLAPTGPAGRLDYGDVNTRIFRREATERQKAIAEEIDALEKSSAVRKESSTAAIASANAEIDRLDAKANLTKQETEELQRQITVRRELLKLQSDTAAAERAKSSFQALQDAKRKAADDAAAAEAAGKDLVTGAGEAGKKFDQRADYQAEILALQLQLSGRKALADQMREETALRKEALAMADNQGITEEAALKLAAERARLLKQITEQEEKAALRAQKHPQWKPRSEYRGITRAENAARDFNAGNNLRDWTKEWRNALPTRSNGRPIKSAEGSLKQEALRRRQQERETDALRNSSDPSIRIGQQSLDVQQQLLEGLKRIGVLQ